jgi:hypothetical protein
MAISQKCPQRSLERLGPPIRRATSRSVFTRLFSASAQFLPELMGVKARTVEEAGQTEIVGLQGNGRLRT